VAGPLTGLTVVEMAGLGPCPLAGQLLSDLGADVTVIDRASSDADDTDINRRGKRSIALNLKDPNGRDIAEQLIDRADVLIEGFRPGVMERLGLGPKPCQARNERLVYARVTGWGQTGPLSKLAGHDINYLAITGALAAIGTKNSGPIPPLNLVADYAGGSMFLVFGIMSALYERERSGHGQVIDAAMIDGVPAMMGLVHQWFANGDWSTQRESNLLDGSAPFYRCYQTADNLYVAVGALESKFYAQLIDLLKLPLEMVDEQYDRCLWATHQQALSDAFMAQTQAHWISVFAGTDACVTPVLTLEDVAEYPHNAERGVFHTDRDLLQAAPAPRFDRTPADTPNTPYAPGANTRAVLSELGLSNEAQIRLRESGVVSGPD